MWIDIAFAHNHQQQQIRRKKWTKEFMNYKMINIPNERSVKYNWMQEMFQTNEMHFNRKLFVHLFVISVNTYVSTERKRRVTE